MMNMEQFSTKQLIYNFNHSDMRRKMIPQELASGWPCVRKIGKTLCLTIPYYSRSVSDNRIALYPIYCSVTVPIGNPDRLMDFTIYPHQQSWSEFDYKEPVGYFKHEALAEVNTKAEYQALCTQLYEYYDQMIVAILERRPFENEQEMITLFSKMMEPGHYSQYLAINEKFYSHFCRL